MEHLSVNIELVRKKLTVHASIKGMLKRYKRFVGLIELFIAKLEKNRE